MEGPALYEGTQATSLTWSSCGVVTMINMIVIQKAVPSIRNTRPIYLDLHPGEVYYQPMGWAHSVENLDDSLMVNFWFGRYKHGAITEVRGCDAEREKPKRTIEATRRQGNVLLVNATWASGQVSRPRNTEGHYTPLQPVQAHHKKPSLKGDGTPVRRQDTKTMCRLCNRKRKRSSDLAYNMTLAVSQ